MIQAVSDHCSSSDSLYNFLVRFSSRDSLVTLVSVSPGQCWLQIITPGCHTNHTNVCQISHTHTRPLTSPASQSRHRTSRPQPIGARHGGHVTRILQRWIWFWQTLIWFVWQIWVINILHCTNLTWKHFYIWSLMKYEPTCISPKPLLF